MLVHAPNCMAERGTHAPFNIQESVMLAAMCTSRWMLARGSIGRQDAASIFADFTAEPAEHASCQRLSVDVAANAKVERGNQHKLTF